LGCNAEGFPIYQGDPDMLRVHKFMNLNEVQLDYFNTQVALAAQALGVDAADATTYDYQVGLGRPVQHEMHSSPYR
jgi:hypothetical protein